MIKNFVLTFLAFCCVVFLTGCSSGASYISDISDTEPGPREATVTDDESAGEGAEPPEDMPDESHISRDETEELFVFVCGAVNEPGVYKFADGTRIYEAVNAAGGFAPDADDRFLNLAEAVRDGQQLYVPTEDETKSGAVPDTGIQNSGGKNSDLININTASASELTGINGIGEARAGDIVAYREQNGAFSRIEDIMKVPGIKDGLFNRIKDRITV